MNAAVNEENSQCFPNYYDDIDCIINNHFKFLKLYSNKSVLVEGMSRIASYRCELTGLLELHMSLLSQLGNSGLTYLQYITFLRDYEKFCEWFKDDYPHLTVCSLSERKSKSCNSTKNFDIPDSWICHCGKLEKSIRTIKLTIKKSNYNLTDEELRDVCSDLLKDIAAEAPLEQG